MKRNLAMSLSTYIDTVVASLFSATVQHWQNTNPVQLRLLLWPESISDTLDTANNEDIPIMSSETEMPRVIS